MRIESDLNEQLIAEISHYEQHLHRSDRSLYDMCEYIGAHIGVVLNGELDGFNIINPISEEIGIEHSPATQSAVFNNSLSEDRDNLSVLEKENLRVEGVRLRRKIGDGELVWACHQRQNFTGLWVWRLYIGFAVQPSGPDSCRIISWWKDYLENPVEDDNPLVCVLDRFCGNFSVANKVKIDELYEHGVKRFEAINKRLESLEKTFHVLIDEALIRAEELGKHPSEIGWSMLDCLEGERDG